MKTFLTMVSLFVAAAGMVFADEAPAAKAAEAAPAAAKTTVKHATKPAAKPKLSWLKGSVASVDATASKLSIKPSKGDAKDVVVEEGASLMKGKDKITLADIAAGDNVAVGYTSKDGVLTAKSVKVSVPKAKPAAK